MAFSTMTLNKPSTTRWLRGEKQGGELDERDRTRSPTSLSARLAPNIEAGNQDAEGNAGAARLSKRVKWARIMSGSTGFASARSAPAEMAFEANSLKHPVKTTIGTLLSPERNRLTDLTTSIPSSPGIPTSVIIRSGASLESKARPSHPSLATTTVYPASSNHAAIESRSNGLSSITRTLYCVFISSRGDGCVL